MFSYVQWGHVYPWTQTANRHWGWLWLYSVAQLSIVLCHGCFFLALKRYGLVMKTIRTFGAKSRAITMNRAKQPQHLLEKPHRHKHNFCCGTVHFKELVYSGEEHHIKSAVDKAATPLPLRSPSKNSNYQKMRFTGLPWSIDSKWEYWQLSHHVLASLFITDKFVESPLAVLHPFLVLSRST